MMFAPRGSSDSGSEVKPVRYNATDPSKLFLPPPGGEDCASIPAVKA